ncbi:hypothetical protein [Paenibacillus sp. Soil522]|uniref:hypothetical protein n=1 Tax=Paenibacillus sp. Soil522 TaxID=1736388 RepID=UPI00138F5371|nr:hypothetical protein [Paenibacillus sp. Soil522]
MATNKCYRNLSFRHNFPLPNKEAFGKHYAITCSGEALPRWPILQQGQMVKSLPVSFFKKFFADAANGDQFAFPILNGKIVKKDIYVWNHEDDSRT